MLFWVILDGFLLGCITGGVGWRVFVALDWLLLGGITDGVGGRVLLALDWLLLGGITAGVGWGDVIAVCRDPGIVKEWLCGKLDPLHPEGDVKGPESSM